MLKSVPINQDGAVAREEGQAPPLRWVLASLSLSMLMPALDTSIANAGLPTLARAFAAPFQAVQWVVIAYLLAITTLIVSVGRLGDLMGRRRLLLAGIGLFTLASLLCGAAPGLWLLLAARAAQGIGAAIMLALTVAMVGAAVPKASTGSAMGLLGTMSAVGTTLGPGLGGLLMTQFGWRSIFLVNLPLGVLNYLLARRYLPVDQPRHMPDHADFDMTGTLLLALSLGAYALAMTTGQGHFGGSNLALLLVATLGGSLFVWVESRAESPLIRPALLRQTTLSTSLAMNGLVSTVMMATLVVGPFYLARGLGLGTAQVGLVLSAGPLMSALSGVIAGRVVDRLGAPGMVMAGLGAMAAGAFALSLLPGLFGVAGYIAAIALLTPGYQLFQAANNTALMTGIAPDQRGLIAGLLSLSRNLGLVTGAALMGAVFAFTAGTSNVAEASREAVATGLRDTFWLATMLIVLALALAAGHRLLRCCPR